MTLLRPCRRKLHARGLPILATLLAACFPAGASFYFTPDVPTVLGGALFQPWDIVLKNDAGAYSLALSLPAGTPIDGLYRMNSGAWLLSVASPTVLGGVAADPRDVIRFDGVATYSTFFNGAAAGIPAGANVDGLFLEGGDAGDLVLSFDVPTTIGVDVYEPADLVRTSGGLFSLYFDASASVPPIPRGINVTGAGRRGTRTFLAFDGPISLGTVLFGAGAIVTWDGAAFAPFSPDAAWPPGSGLSALALGACLDGDGDGYGSPGDASCPAGATADCDDVRSVVRPGGAQTCDGLNNDCSHPSYPGLAGTNELSDDGDAFTECQGDCDDARAAVYPGAAQICDGLNNDCQHPSWPGLQGTSEADDDADGLTECAGDCNDASAAVRPGAPQICDGLNNDCLDPNWPIPPAIDVDDDGDGMTECAGDCDDSAAAVYTGAPQNCDGRNNDCAHPSWPALMGTNEFDDDGDGFTECTGDCTDAQGSVWGTPGAVLALMVGDGGVLTWSVPADPGGSPALVVYDTIRSTNPSNFVTAPPATCVESDDGPNTTATDTPTPAVGQAFFYLVRAQNPCPGALGIGTLGTTSSGAPRSARDCP